MKIEMTMEDDLDQGYALPVRDHATRSSLARDLDEANGKIKDLEEAAVRSATSASHCIKDRDSVIMRLHGDRNVWEERARDLVDQIEAAERKGHNLGWAYELQTLAKNVAGEVKEWDNR